MSASPIHRKARQARYAPDNTSSRMVKVYSDSGMTTSCFGFATEGSMLGISDRNHSMVLSLTSQDASRIYRHPSSIELNTAVSFSRLIGLKRCPHASFLKRLSSKKASAPTIFIFSCIKACADQALPCLQVIIYTPNYAIRQLLCLLF